MTSVSLCCVVSHSTAWSDVTTERGSMAGMFLMLLSLCCSVFLVFLLVCRLGYCLFYTHVIFFITLHFHIPQQHHAFPIYCCLHMCLFSLLVYVPCYHLPCVAIVLIVLIDSPATKREVYKNARWALFEAEKDGSKQLLVIFSDNEVRRVGIQNLRRKFDLFQKVSGEFHLFFILINQSCSCTWPWVAECFLPLIYCLLQTR